MLGFAVGQKLKLKITCKDKIVRAKVLAVYPTYTLFKFKKYNTTFSNADFIEGIVKVVG